MAQRYKTLADYFEQTDQPLAMLARELGVSRVYIHQLVTRKRTPSLPVALRIVRLTGVPIESLVSPTTSQERVA